MSRVVKKPQMEGIFGSILRRLSALERNVFGNEDWTLASPGSGFANSGGVNAVLAYYKDNAGIVHLKGVLTVPATASGQTILTLPANYRPAESHRFGVIQGTTNTARVDVDNAGNVTYQGAGGTGAIDLSDVFFRAEQ